MLNKNQYLEATTIQLEMWDQWFEALEENLESTRAKVRKSFRPTLSRARRLKRRVEARLLRADRRAGEGWVEARGELESAATSFRSVAIELYDKAREVLV